MVKFWLSPLKPNALDPSLYPVSASYYFNISKTYYLSRLNSSQALLRLRTAFVYIRGHILRLCRGAPGNIRPPHNELVEDPLICDSAEHDTS